MNRSEAHNLARVWQNENKHDDRSFRMMVELILLIAQDIDLRRVLTNKHYREFILSNAFQRKLRTLAIEDAARKRELFPDTPKKDISLSFSLALVHLAGKPKILRNLISGTLGEELISAFAFLDKD